MTSKGHERYIRHLLLLHLGFLTIREILNKEIGKQGNVLSVLLRNAEPGIRLKIPNETQLHALFLPDGSVNVDMDTWNLSLLCNVALHLFGKHLQSYERNAIQCILKHHEDVTRHSKFASLDYMTYTHKLKEIEMSTLDLLSGLGTKYNFECKRMLHSYKLENLHVNATLIEQLKKKSTLNKEIIPISESSFRRQKIGDEQTTVLEEFDKQSRATAKELEEIRKISGIIQKSSANTNRKLCNEDIEEQINIQAKTIVSTARGNDRVLTAIKAVATSKHRTEMNSAEPTKRSLESAIQTLLDPIMKLDGVKITDVIQKCVIMKMRCKRVNDVKQLLDIQNDTKRQDQLQKVAGILQEDIGCKFEISSHVTIDCLKKVQKHLNDAKQDVVVYEGDKNEEDYESFRQGIWNTFVCYSVPLSCWPRIKQAQSDIQNLLKFCTDIQDELGLGHTGGNRTVELQKIYIYAEPKYDIGLLLPVNGNITKKGEILLNVSINSDDTEKQSRESTIEGILIYHSVASVIKSLKGPYMVLCRTKNNDRSRTKKKFRQCCIGKQRKDTIMNMHLEVCDLIERIVYEPLIAKSIFFGHLLNAQHLVYRNKSSENNQLNVTDNKPSDADSAEVYSKEQREGTSVFDESIIKQIKLREGVIEDLFGEMIAMINNSSIRENDVMELKDYRQKRQTDKEICRMLFDSEGSVIGCGYRLNTFHVSVQKLSSLKENDREQRIRHLLKCKGITDVKFDTVSEDIKYYNHVGAQIGAGNETPEDVKCGTLGCFATCQREGSTSTCALFSKHVAIGCSRIFINNGEGQIFFGKILYGMENDGGYDIAAAVIDNKHIPKCNMSFKTIENKQAPAKLYRKVDGIKLEGQTVYLWGAISTPGIGTIRFPEFCCKENPETTYIILKDGSYKINMPDAKLAQPGDSGAIVCMNKPDENKVLAISMLMGERVLETETKSEYVAFYLWDGMQHLSSKTNGIFHLKGVHP